eukprot:CAMPEP_0194669898 /NCGR_PEP_ID=MMETSP0295-20121207/4864_1 /TAXON_ID=39354 /ORGANISM="Heterosigma akashiwo, Strain CCMP2393" /LENGTH=67 /DNA_ID=CAMNT_0039552985 /DNA_START=355 /DNA_END=559 /DNA_ORIENTATION=+
MTFPVKGQVQVSGAVQFAPFPQVWAQTGVVQLASAQPLAQLQVSGNAQVPLFAQVCTQSGSSQSAPE